MTFLLCHIYDIETGDFIRFDVLSIDAIKKFKKHKKDFHMIRDGKITDEIDINKVRKVIYKDVKVHESEPLRKVKIYNIGEGEMLLISINFCYS